jgi:hypothetical protein
MLFLKIKRDTKKDSERRRKITERDYRCREKKFQKDELIHEYEYLIYINDKFGILIDILINLNSIFLDEIDNLFIFFESRTHSLLYGILDIPFDEQSSMDIFYNKIKEKIRVKRLQLSRIL